MNENRFPILTYDQDIASSTKRVHLQLLKLSEEMFSVATALITDNRIDISKARGIGPATLHTSTGVYNKMCKLFRGVYLLSEQGMAREAEILARSQFEALLAYYFLMKPRLILRQNGKKLPPIPGKSLTTKFRTSLYLAHRAIESLRKVEYYARTPGLKRFAMKLNREKLKENSQLWEAEIGSEWTKRLKRARTYSGLKIKDLAISLGLGSAYDTAYFFMSDIAHGADGMSYIKGADLNSDIELKWYAEPGEIVRVLVSSNLSMCASAQLLNKRLGLGQKKQLDLLWQRIIQTSQ